MRLTDQLLEEFSEYLALTMTPERQDLILSFSDHLLHMNYTDHLYDMDSLLSYCDFVENESTCERINERLIHHGILVLKQLGIFISTRDLPLRLLNEIIDTFRHLPNYGDYEYILTILNNDEQPEFQCAEIIGHYQNKTPSLYYSIIDRVKEDLINRLKELMEELIIDPETSNTLIKHRSQAFLSYHPDNLAKKALQEGYRLGTSFEVLLDRYLIDLRDHRNNKIALSQHTLGLLLISHLPSTTIEKKGIEVLSFIIKDLNQLSKIKTYFSHQLLPKFL